MRILMTANATWNVSNFRSSLIKAMIDDGHHVSVLAPYDESAAKLEGLGCKVIPLEMNVKGLNPVQDLKLMGRMRKVFQAERPDVIFSYTIKNNIFGALAARPLAIPFIPNVTGLGTAFLSGSVLQSIAEGLYRRAFRHLQVVFFQNEDDKALFLKRRLVTPEQPRLLPGSGVDLSHFAQTQYPTASDAPVFLMISRLLRDKGVFEFAEAARKVKLSHPSARFQLLGPLVSANRTAIDAATIASWEDQGVIEYLGVADDVRSYIAAAQCVVLPSYREGAPRTLLEAAAMARPLITTDVPGCRSVVENGANGYLCKVRDGDDLAKSMNEFLALSPAERAHMGTLGRAKVTAEFDQAIVVRAYKDALDSTRLNQATSNDTICSEITKEKVP